MQFGTVNFLSKRVRWLGDAIQHHPESWVDPCYYWVLYDVQQNIVDDKDGIHD